MWFRRLALGALVLPLALLIIRDAPVRLGLPDNDAAAPATPRGVGQPPIVSRAAWHADEHMVREPATYTGAARIVFLHHTGQPNDYDCADVPRMLRAVETDHIQGNGWDDLGYNFVVDRCGTIYEGRAGGVTRPVEGAHTKGFNDNSVGIAALGTFGAGVPVPPALEAAIVKVAAWKLAEGVDPLGTVRMVSTNNESTYKKGRPAELHVISGHRDTYQTRCPGDALYDRLPAIRQEVARTRAEAAARARARDEATEKVADDR